MTPINLKQNKILDGERIFKMYYLEMGSARSIKKVIKQLGDEAINPRTGRIVTDMAIFWSMYRWAFEHLDESYEIFNKAMFNEGQFSTLDEWKEFLYKKAGLITKHSQKGLERWEKRVQKRAVMISKHSEMAKTIVESIK